MRATLAQRSLDADLVAVLDLATGPELAELYRALHGPSLLSPAFKSLALQHADDRQLRSRGQVIAVLESRLRFLGASASGVLAGRLPPYRAVLLDLWRRLAVPCHPRLSTQDLEAEIFVHLCAQQGSWLGSAGPMGRLRRAASIAAGKDARLTAVESSARWSPVQIAVGRICDAAVPLGIAARGSLRLGSEAAALALLGRAWSGALLQRLPAEGARTSGALAGLATGTLGAGLWACAAWDLAALALGTDYARLCRAVFLLAQIRLVRTQGFNVSGAP